MSCYWISWYETAEDNRPFTFPPPKEILGWWCTGYRDDDAATLCAVVDAETEEAAKAAVRKSWPCQGIEQDREWRFCEPWNHKLSDRFPLSDWMGPRFSGRLEPEKL